MTDPLPRTPYGVVIDRNVPALMRDGVTLCADVWRPNAEGRFPVLLLRTPYGKQVPQLMPNAGVDALRTVAEGYVVIVQDTRGRGASAGTWSFECEGDDGYDSVEWAAGLPYSDGNVGMYGISYLAFAQWMAAINKPPHLKALFVQQFGTCIHSFMAQGGAFHLGGALLWAAVQAPDSILRRAATGENVLPLLGELDVLLNSLPDAYARLPLAGSNELISKVSPYYDDWLARLDDAAHWERTNVGSRLSEIDLPVYHLGGWYDIYNGDVPAVFSGMCREGGSDKARRSQKLLMGPWVHALFGSDYITEPNMTMRASAMYCDIPGLHIRWFDHWLKGKDTGILNEPPVRLFVMGDNTWRTENEWPLARTVWTNYYLHSDGRANGRDGDGTLSPEPPAASERPDSFQYDPSNPVPSWGGPNLLPAANSGPKEQSRIETRPDVLVYTTPPLEQDIEVTGPVTATIFAATSAVDTDWTVKLVDVYPDGSAYGVVDGIIRARYRDRLGQASLLEPGRPYEYSIDLQATSIAFKRGHRIRVQVSSSNFPRFARNTNSGGPLATDATLVVAQQTVLHDATHPSHVRLPVIPR